MAKEYIEKKAVTEWLAAKSRVASQHAEAQTKFGDADGGHCFSAESVAYLETETFINSLPTKEFYHAVGEAFGDKLAEKTEILFCTDGELTIYSFVGAPRWWATIREAEEALSLFKAGILYERERLMKGAEVIEGIVVGRVADHINIKVEGGDYLSPKGVMHIVADKSKYEIGDKVKLIILK